MAAAMRARRVRGLDCDIGSRSGTEGGGRLGDADLHFELGLLIRSALAGGDGAVRDLVDAALQQLARQGIEPDYIAAILAAYGPGDASPLADLLLQGEPDSSAAASALLTNRERDVLRLLAQRYTDKEIAETLADKILAEKIL